MAKEKKESSFKAGCLGCLGILVILAIVIGGCSMIVFKDDAEVTQTENKENDQKKIVKDETDKEDLKEEKKSSIDWEKEIVNISNTNQSKTEKFDSIEAIARDFISTDANTSKFANDIITHYQKGDYLELNEQQFLTQIFKASVVERNTSGDINEFAFDYWQVQKYVYRGAEQPDSQFVQSNESQMNKSLKLIK